MMSFKDMLLESKAGKNLHLEHLEDEIRNLKNQLAKETEKNGQVKST